MSDDNLKLVETCALLVLMCEAREVPNSYLTNEVGLSLKKDERNRLVKFGLVEVREDRRRLFLNLTDEGWRRALSAIGDQPPKRSGSAGAAIYQLIGTLRRFLTRSGFAPADFFVPAEPEPEPAPGESTATTDDIAALIRKAYDRVARSPGDSVKLVRIRAELNGIDSGRVDQALVAMSGNRDVRIFPESNQKTLTDEDRAAAVSIGNRDKHLIAIDG